MISVDEALAQVFALVSPLDIEDVPIAEAAGRVLARDILAARDQPPFAASAMDGYAVRGADVRPGAALTVIGAAAAGHASGLSVGPNQAVRIFTGAPLPDGADKVVIQEDTERTGDTVTLGDKIGPSTHIRPAGADFAAGAALTAPRRLGAVEIALAAAMNQARLPCTRRPEVALIATGDELVVPGAAPRPDQIVASNAFGLKAMIEAEGARARILPIAPDTEHALAASFDLAQGADLIVTIGGASVGDHDLVGQVAAARGMRPAFYKIAMRPGKPLMAGMLDGVPMIGLPGNPVSSIVCGHIFVLPALRAMMGLPAEPAPRRQAALGAALGPNGPRAHYMRARVEEARITAFDRQDSALLSVLAEANALLVRPVGDPARDPGERVDYVPL